jgi:hypothetical protein
MTVLPEEQRSIIALAFWEGLSHSEVAVRTGVPFGTAATVIVWAASPRAPQTPVYGADPSDSARSITFLSSFRDISHPVSMSDM